MTEPPARLAHLSPATLAPLVRSALQAEAASVVDWQLDTLAGGAGDQGAGTSGLYRLRGHAQVPSGEQRPWQMVLKYARPALDSDEVTGSEREWQAYASGVLADLGSGLSAPRCLGAETRPDGERWLWLEGVADERDDWSHAQYARAAQHLGEFNARFASAPPDWPWLSRQWLRGWVAQRAGDVEMLRALRLENPDVQRAFPPDVAAGCLALWDDRERLLDALEALPQTFCHLDAFRRNLLTRTTPAGEGLVLIDWAFAGLAAPGEELAALIVASEGFEHAANPDMPSVEAAAYPAYMAGLRAAGWHGDERAVRLAYCAAAALRYGLPIAMPVYVDAGARSWFEAVFRTPFEVLADQSPRWRRYLLGLAGEARGLIAALC